MSGTLETVDEGIYTISGVMTAKECQELIERAEAIGFSAASVKTSSGQRMMTNIRNNDRVNLHDVELANTMWQRVSRLLPVLDSCKPVSVDPNLRFYRYDPGQQFKRHKDGSVTNDLGEVSKLSYLIYLNDDYAGGSTTFLEFRDVDGVREKREFVISPKAGSALLFLHERWHEGTSVSCGTKYVLRSDVFYSHPITGQGNQDS
jgi:predicted 2-oxoglutarate/Fe(II)-dependent dioxygenase YbiX